MDTGADKSGPAINPQQSITAGEGERQCYRERIYQRYVELDEKGMSIEYDLLITSREPYIKKLVANLFPPDRDARILDLGCGKGALIYVARKLGYKNTMGIDVSPEQVAMAAHLGISEVKQGDLGAFLGSQPASSWDCVVAFDVIEHFTKPEAVHLLDLIHKVLVTDGRLIIHTPNGESQFGGRMRYGDFTHEICLTRRSITQLLMAAGFRKVICYEDMPVIHGFFSLIRWILWKLIRGILRLYLAAETGDTGRDAIFSQNFCVLALK